MKYKAEIYSGSRQPTPETGRRIIPNPRFAGLRLACCLAAWLSGMHDGYAFDWIYQPEIDVTQRYTDNLRMQLQPTRSNLITTLSPSFILGYLAAENELQVKLNWNQLLYDDQTSLNFSERIASFTHTYRNEKWITTLTGRYGYESSLASQLGVNGSGNLTTQVPRESETIKPDVIYRLTETNSLEFTGSYTAVNFASHPSTGYFDYTNSTLNAIATHRYNEKLSFNFNTGYTIYDAGNTIDTGNYLGISSLPVEYTYKQNSKTLSYQLGFSYQFDERTLISGSAGLRDSNSKSNIANQVPGLNCSHLSPLLTCPDSYETVTSTTNGKLYSASVKRDLEKGIINISYNQQLNPASTGSQQQTSQISASLDYNVSERWNTGFNYTYLISDYVAGLYTSSAYVNLNNRTLNMISPNIKWKWTPEMYFQLSYTYMDQNYTLQNLNAVGNNMQLQFIYQPQINRQVK
ncbi:MAG: hypothetical protein PHW13_00315 [Methylococcales bacterium]|nr:hypothetical protein [Methylococcales bacterium]